MLTSSFKRSCGAWRSSGALSRTRYLTHLTLTVLVMAVAAVALAGAVTGCSAAAPPPDAVVRSFMDALKTADLAKAAGYMANAGADLRFDDPQQEKMIKSYLGQLKYENVAKPVINGDAATVAVKMTAPDLVRISADALTQALPLMFAAASSDSVQKQKAEETMLEMLFSAISDPKAPVVSAEIKVSLKRVEGKWLVVADDGLGQILLPSLGNLTGQ